jgi:hypothetical protein
MTVRQYLVCRECRKDEQHWYKILYGQVILVAKWGTRRVGTEEGFCTSLVGTKNDDITNKIMHLVWKKE